VLTSSEEYSEIWDEASSPAKWIFDLEYLAKVSKKAHCGCHFYPGSK
jgi:hypothetical protein